MQLHSLELYLVRIVFCLFLLVKTEFEELMNEQWIHDEYNANWKVNGDTTTKTGRYKKEMV